MAGGGRGLRGTRRRGFGRALGAAAKVEGGRFTVAKAAAKNAAKQAKNANKAKNKKKQQAKNELAKQAQKKQQQQAAGGAILRATVDAPENSRVTVRVGEDRFAFALNELVPECGSHSSTGPSPSSGRSGMSA